MGNWDCFLPCLLVMFLLSQVNAATYYMDRQDHCGQIQAYDVQRDEMVTIYAKTGDTLSSQGSCSLSFKAIDTDAKVQIEFTTFSIQDCGVTLYITGAGTGNTDTYKCGDNPKTWFSSQRSVTLTLHKMSPTASTYNFQLKLVAIRDSMYPNQNDANPMAVGMVVGVVGAVFGVIIIVACVGVCCFRKYRARGSAGKSPYLYEKNSKVPLDDRSSHASAGYTNDSIKAGASPMAKKKLLQNSSGSSGSEHNSRPNTLNLYKRNNYSNYPASQAPVAPPPPDMKSYETSPKSGNLLLDNKGRSENVFRYDNETKKSAEQRVNMDTKSANPVISALNGNSKFRRSMELNNKEAEERAKRISSGSSLEGLGQAPTPPTSEEDLRKPPKLPSVPKVQQSPKSKHAVIRRAPRPTSVSSDELIQIERGRTKSESAVGNRFINDDSSSSQSEVANITAGAAAKTKTDTTHSLKPDRSRGPKGHKKQTKSVSSTADQETLPKHLEADETDQESLPRQFQRGVLGRGNPQKDRILNEEYEKTSSGRYNKRPNTGRSTPRSSGGKGYTKGFSHRRGRSADHLDSRPTTPNSAFGSMESLPPLARSSSKTSLYASREKLYDRRGRSPRRRKGSYTESVASTRDDMSIMRHSRGYDDYYSDEDFDGYERPLSRRDRDRMYKSETDIGKHLKAASTQTLRETATQTGPNETVDVKTKIVMKQKKRSKSMSTSGTQTRKHRNGRMISSSESSDSDVKRTARKKPSKGLKTAHSDSEVKMTKVRSKSVDQIDNASAKPKPKPKPRKSTAADLDEVKKSASMENLVGPNPQLSVPTSQGFVPQAMYPGQYYPQMGYPMGPPPSYPGQPGFVGQGQPMQNQYPQTFGGVPPVSTQPPNVRKKSNWEVLCELTDSGYVRDDVTETGSVASSVFTNNPQSLPGYGLPPGGQGYYPPPVGYQQQQQYGYQPQMAAPVGQRQVAPAVQPAGIQDKTLNKQSSWDALKQITVSDQQQSNGMQRNESVV